MRTSVIVSGSLIVVLGIVLGIIFLKTDGTKNLQLVTAPSANYQPKPFSSYVQSTIVENTEPTSGQYRQYIGTIIFRSEEIVSGRKQTCYMVLAEDQILFPLPISKVCANNTSEQLADIHVVGGVDLSEKEIRYLVTVQDPKIEGDVASGLILQIRKRSISEDVELD